GVANARLAYELFEEQFATERAQALLAAGANLQRPLWASTGVKDPALPDTLYVTELVARGVVNTMPEKTLEATFDHGVVTGDTVTGEYASAGAVLDALASVGVDYDDVTALLEREGVEKFNVSWGELLDSVTAALEAAR
ncbi:MAG TPA: transaldolase family protein, partial [Agromyces sp.]